MKNKTFIYSCLLAFLSFSILDSITAQTCNDPNAHNTGQQGACETCFDNIQNGDEEGVDCGGTNPNCATCPVSIRLDVDGNIRFNSNALISTASSPTNVDHIWHDDANDGTINGKWHFVADQAYKTAGNTQLRAGSVYMAEADHDNYFAGDVNIGVVNGRHMNIDNLGLRALNNNTTGGGLYLNHSGGDIFLGQSNSQTPTKLTLYQGTSVTSNGFFLQKNSLFGTPLDNWQLFIYSDGSLGFRENGNSVRYLEEDGDFLLGSDRKLKQNIQYLDNELEKILQLRPATYQYKTQKDDEAQYGFIAQEVQEIYPDLVSILNEESEEKMLGVSYEEFIPLLVMGMQEQQEIIEEKEERLLELEARLSKLENLLAGKTENQQLNEQTTSLTDAQLYPNQPNPFTDKTLIRYYIPQGSKKAEMRITSLEGKVIKVVPIQASGKGQLTVNAQSLSAGTYLYSLLVDGELIATEKMILTGKN